FFALSMLSAAPVFKTGRLERTVRVLMTVSGVLSLAGLIGVPLADMNVRNIGIIGYAVVSIVVFLLLGIVFGRARPVPGVKECSRMLQSESNKEVYFHIVAPSMPIVPPVRLPGYQ